MRLALGVIAPVFCVRLPVPVKVKSPFHAIGLEMVIPPPLVLSIVPPAIVNVPVPSAEALLIFNVPALKVVPPLNVFAPDSVHIPASCFVTVPAPVPIILAIVLLAVPVPVPPRVKL